MKKILLPLLLALHASTAWAVTETFCKTWAKKLRTVTYEGCMALQLQPSGYFSVRGQPLMLRGISPDDPPRGRVLFIGGIHGDEWAAVSVSYLWLQALLEHRDLLKSQWLFLPVANPDGLFRSPSTRTNAQGVDLNRNFPSPDWTQLAHKWWLQYKRSNPRYFPGPEANSEPETRFIVRLIHEYRPDVIISLHAPYNLLDYDGPEHAVPQRLGHLKLRQLGTYPGSLGRYAGEYLHIPVLTIELKSATRMPRRSEIRHMLDDLQRWIEQRAESPLPLKGDAPMNSKATSDTSSESRPQRSAS